MDGLQIDLINTEHAGELLTLQRAAFVTEAQHYDNPRLPALTQTYEELLADIDRVDVVMIGAWLGYRLVGAIRVQVEGERANLGRFAVAPDLQGQGIGTEMLMRTLDYVPESISEVWVFTGQDSQQSLNVYAKTGFEHQYDTHTGDLTYAYLRKILGEDGEDVDEEVPAPADAAAPTTNDEK